MVITFIITLRLSIPFVLVAWPWWGSWGSLKVVIIVLGLLLWNRYAVVMRSATQQIRNQDYIPAAEAVGCSTPGSFFPRSCQHREQPGGSGHAGDGQRHPARGSPFLPGLGYSRHAFLGTHGLRGQGLPFLRALADYDSGVALFVLVLAINLLGMEFET